jgi:cbb3-type cytochrome oxidase subunit 3
MRAWGLLAMLLVLMMVVSLSTPTQAKRNYEARSNPIQPLPEDRARMDKSDKNVRDLEKHLNNQKAKK